VQHNLNIWLIALHSPHSEIFLHYFLKYAFAAYSEICQFPIVLTDQSDYGEAMSAKQVNWPRSKHSYVDLSDGRRLHVVEHLPFSGVAATTTAPAAATPASLAPPATTAPAAATSEAKPPVVFESGLGLSRLLWANVAHLLAKAGYRTISYDRSGLGRSPAATERNLEALVADLEQVVRAYAPQGAIIVGHSYGGIMARLLTARQPQLVKALVLVDPSSEFVGAQIGPLGKRLEALFDSAITFSRDLKLLPIFLMAAGYKHLPARLQQKVRVEDVSDAALKARRQENKGYYPALAKLREQPLPHPQVPVEILLASSSPESEWFKAHSEYASKLPDAHLWQASTSSHMVPLLKPQEVALAVKQADARRSA
jgi:hydrolase, alpha/beta domain protein